MALFCCQHFSDTLQKCMRFYTVIPENVPEDIPVVYVLHGLSDDASVWLRRTNIEYLADLFGMALVLPDGEKSFYTNMACGENFYDYVSREIPAYVNKTFAPLSKKREKTFICGISMGGYGALKIAFRNPDRFGAVCGMSSVSDIAERVRRATFEDVIRLVFGDRTPEKIAGSEEDLFALAGNLEKQKSDLRILQMCGTEDFLYEDNIRFRDYMKKTGLDYTYFEEPGNHDWGTWNRWLPEVFRFFQKT